LPEPYRHLRHALAADVPAVLAAAALAGLSVEGHVFVRQGRQTVRRVFVPKALVPDSAAPEGLRLDGDEMIRVRDIRALRILDPATQPE
jgi:hypothetical protein